MLFIFFKRVVVFTNFVSGFKCLSINVDFHIKS